MTRPLDALITRIGQASPAQKPFLREAVARLRDTERRDLDAYIRYCADEGLSLDLLAESYALIVKDTFKEQIYFQRHKRYRYATFEEVADAVYFNEAYMQRYMIGLALSAFLWENHLQMLRFFIASLPEDASGRYLEVGPGHGFYFMQAMRHARFEHYTGIDLSETSVAMTRSILSSHHFGAFSRYTLRCEDFLDFEEAPRAEAPAAGAPQATRGASSARGFAFQVMSEVLEHVEEPARFLRKLAAQAAPGGQIFITTCIHAPAVDHIYLYTDQEHVRRQIEGAGLQIDEELWLPYAGTTMERSLKEKLPINLALVLSCRG